MGKQRRKFDAGLKQQIVGEVESGLLTASAASRKYQISGSVICASVEYHGGTESQAFQLIDQKIRGNTEEVLASAKKSSSLPRQAAVALAERRVRQAMDYRRG